MGEPPGREFPNMFLPKGGLRKTNADRLSV